MERYLIYEELVEVVYTWIVRLGLGLGLVEIYFLFREGT